MEPVESTPYNSTWLFNQYVNGGLIMRTNDGQTPTSIEDFQNYIKSNWASKKDGSKSPNFFGLVQNSAPAYSTTVLGAGDPNTPCPPFAWYNPDYSQAVDGSGKALDPTQYGKVVVAVVFNPYKIQVGGATCFDADSNLRNAAVISNNFQNSKLTTESLFSLKNTFEYACTVFKGEQKCSSGEGQDVDLDTWDDPTPKSQNNNPLINPLLVPNTASLYGFVSDSDSPPALTPFLKDVCTTKGIWWDVMFKNKNFVNPTDTVFINCLKTGVEIEAETYPAFLQSNNQILTKFGSLKFNPNSIATLVVLRDSNIKPLPDNFKQDYITPFLATAQGDGGWIDASSQECSLGAQDLGNLPVSIISNVWMPSVPVEGTSASDVNIAEQISKIATQSNNVLSKGDFVDM